MVSSQTVLGVSCLLSCSDVMGWYISNHVIHRQFLVFQILDLTGGDSVISTVCTDGSW